MSTETHPPLYEPFALLDMWLNATHPDNADWDSEKLIEVILTEYGEVSYEEVIRTIKQSGQNLAEIELKID